jgi:raffinose/stachyose/melibiose transport system substrate-binding protein
MHSQRHRIGWLLNLCLVIALVASIAGCAAPAAPAGDAATPAQEAAPAAGSDAAAGEKTKVVWWTEGGNIDAAVREELQRQLVDTFNASHPDIELELVYQENLSDVLRTAVQAGEGPDIIQTPGPGFLLEFQKAGLVLPLNDFADDYGWKDEILPWAYESGTLEGQLYGLPLTFESMVLLYNTKVFADLGLTPPTNRAEFDAVAKALQDAGLLAISYGNVGWQPTNEHLLGMWLNAYAGSDAVYEATHRQAPLDG